ncbi:peptidase domain-containing ABC transporter [Candidatus Stoquefichus massiliensis]|uniref:peptidase domain-containing ABC transporter n=1 Tax=Candidatus Stoquefichus massiliensis TaxID=1470350 RepID=UPI000488ECCE|nr:peptidase domain-containing ABC transporter [Candidatus Stoquefichus massiliensis]
MFRKYPCTMQHDASDCAAAALSTVMLVYRQEMSLMKIREIIGTDLYGTSVKGIVDGLEKMKFQVKAVRVEIKGITDDMTYPTIAQIHTKEGLDHFVVIQKVKNETFYISDPAKGNLKLKRNEFQELYTGVLIMMIPTSEFERMKYKDKGMWDLFCALILPQKKLLLTIILASFVLSIIGILSSTFSKVLMDEIIPYQLKNKLYIFLLAYGIVILFQNLLSAFKQQIILFLSRKVDIPLLMGYYNHIIHLPYVFFASRRVGDIITRFQDALTIKDIFTTVSVSLVLDIVLSVIAAIILFSLNASLFLILIVMVIVDIILIYVFKKPYKKLNYEQMESNAMMNSHLIESMQNIETVKSQNDEIQQIYKLENRFVSLLKLGYKEGTLQNVQGVISNFIDSLGGLVFMAIGAMFIIDGKMSIGDLLVFQTLSQYFTEPIQSLVSLQLTFQEADIAMTRLNELMSLDREDEHQEDLIKDIDLSGDICFENVCFAYGSRPPVIKDFHLTIPSGKRVALVGESGAGKSTIAKLLLRFMNVNEGKITINGYNVHDIDETYLRKNIAYIPQNIELFTGTIIDNLKIGNPEAKYEEIMTACQMAGASSFIERLPNRYGAFIEEGGSNLSGGEKQRLAIARAILSKSQIFIFDEATSNLDSFSERKIHDLLFKKIRNTTTIIIAHRLLTIINCDLICFIENGKIIEQGTHDELMAMNGQYAKMISLQNMTMQKVNKTVVDEEEINYG